MHPESMMRGLALDPKTIFFTPYFLMILHI